MMPDVKKRLLIVEDEPLVAEDLRDSLAEQGFEIVAVAARLAKALECIATLDFDAAIVDANLVGKSAAPVAVELSRIGRPFIVLSGYSRAQLPAEFGPATFFQKPYRIEQLVDGLKGLLGASRP
jgi:DNA-binding response OmpR family regulator